VEEAAALNIEPWAGEPAPQTVKKGESLRHYQNPLNQRIPIRLNRGFWYFLDLHLF
jgi:hypothetical protein